MGCSVAQCLLVVTCRGGEAQGRSRGLCRYEGVLDFRRSVVGFGRCRRRSHAWRSRRARWTITCRPRPCSRGTGSSGDLSKWSRFSLKVGFPKFWRGAKKKTVRWDGMLTPHRLRERGCGAPAPRMGHQRRRHSSSLDRSSGSHRSGFAAVWFHGLLGPILLAASKIKASFFLSLAAGVCSARERPWGCANFRSTNH